MQTGTRSAAGLVAGWTTLLLLSACQSGGPSATDLPTIRRAQRVTIAYARGDCATVRDLTRPGTLEEWTPGEIRSSTELVRAFCLERDGEDDAARTLYRSIVRDAPRSFAAEDARERLRLRERIEQDPGFERWVDEAASRVEEASDARTPIERVTAEYPPLAHAAGVDGFVVIEFGVTPAGETDEPIVVDADPPLLFDGTGLRAVRRWQYLETAADEPATRQVIRLVFTSGSPLGAPEEESAPDDGTMLEPSTD